MRICITTFGGDGGKSGISQYIMQLLRHLPAAAPDMSFDVVLYADEQDQFIAGKNSVYNALRYGENLRSPIRNIIWHQVSLPRLCARNRYDLLFLPAGNRRLPFAAPCPTVGVFHDFSSLHVAHKYDRFRMLYILRVLPMLVRRLSNVITISESTKRDLIEFARVPRERIETIPIGVDLERYAPCSRGEEAERITERYGIRRPYIVFTSRIEHPGKNHVRLIRAFDSAKSRHGLPHQLVLVGADWSRAEVVHSAARAASHRQDIVFTGYVPAADMPDLYRGADISVFPSLFEGFGMPVAESMACGVPVACANVSSIPEVAGDAGVLFDPYDEKAIAEAMVALLTDSRLRAQCVERGVARSKIFDWATIARQTADVIRRTCAGPH